MNGEINTGDYNRKLRVHMEDEQRFLEANLVSIKDMMVLTVLNELEGRVDGYGDPVPVGICLIKVVSRLPENRRRYSINVRHVAALNRHMDCGFREVYVVLGDSLEWYRWHGIRWRMGHETHGNGDQAFYFLPSVP